VNRPEEVKPYNAAQLAARLRRITESSAPTDRTAQLWFASGRFPAWVVPLLRAYDARA